MTSGGTEANLYGIYLGRNHLEATGRKGEPPPQPIAFYSEDAHYSISKAMDLLRVRAERIPSDEQGRVRVDGLRDAILRADPERHPPLIVANLGTTFTGAYDDVEGICQMLARAGVKDYHLPIDGALGGFFLPFLERSGRAGRAVPRFDFRLPIHSVAVSGHKIIGTPFPCDRVQIIYLRI